MIDIVNSQRPITERDIDRVEAAIDGRLPQQYRKFLLAHNGGRPEPDTIDVEGSNFGATDVSVFYAIDHECNGCDILWHLENLEGYKENKLLPIAGDSCGRSYALVVAEENYGEVYYFDFAEIPPRPFFVARDFNEFLSKLREPTPWELGETDEPPPTT